MKAALAGLLLLVPVLAGVSADKPNILFVLADDLGYGDLGCYGQVQVQTPNIDRLAEQGIRFTDCYSGSTVCTPSRCCLMTGLHTGHTRIRKNGYLSLHPEDVTVAEVLKQAGYTTGIIGKWGLGDSGAAGMPPDQGFDYWFGYRDRPNAHNYYPPSLWKNRQEYPLEGNRDGKKTQYSNDLFTSEALAFIEKNNAQPFFLYLAYTIPHANNGLGKITGDGMEVPDYGPYVNRDWPNPQKGHAAMITRMDSYVGKITARLKSLGIEENTVIFFASDNGPHAEGGADPRFFKSSGQLRGHKRDFYEGGIRVPMIVRWPGKVKAGGVSDKAWAFWDFLPTAADMADIKSPQTDGISMLPVLLGKKQKDHEFLYWEYHRYSIGSDYESPLSQAVRMGKWKAVRTKKGEIELYDLEADVRETRNIADQHPAIVAKIRDYLKNARTEPQR